MQKCGFFLILITVLSVEIVFAQPDPLDEKSWLNESTWPAFVQPRILAIHNTDNALNKLLKERYNAAQQELRNRYVYWLQGIGSLESVFEVSRRAISSRLEVKTPAVDKTTLLKEKLAFAEHVKKQAVALQKKFNRAQTYTDVQTANYYRADAEIELLRAKEQSD